MLGTFVKVTKHIYIACQSTDFRKQIEGLVAIVTMQFKLDHFLKAVLLSFATKERMPLKCYVMIRIDLF